MNKVCSTGAGGVGVGWGAVGMAGIGFKNVKVSESENIVYI